MNNTVQSQQQQINQLTQSLHQLTTRFDDEFKVMDVDLKFDRYDSRYIAIDQNGKRIRTISHTCSYICVYSSTGYNSGIKEWKIKITDVVHGSTEQVGIVTQIYNGTNCFGKQISTDGGIASGAGLANGDVMTITLNFQKGRLIILKNGNHLKVADIQYGTTYYPTVQLCACRNQTIEV